jgi:hypothetical protein
MRDGDVTQYDTTRSGEQMGPLIKGIIFGTIGAILAIPALIILAVFGLPIFIVGAVLMGVFVAVPFIVLAALALPMLLVVAITFGLFVIAVVVALKLALFVVLPILLVALGISWLVRTAQAHRHEYA